jgi:hypothetical protein
MACPLPGLSARLETSQLEKALTKGQGQVSKASCDRPRLACRTNNMGGALRIDVTSELTETQRAEWRSFLAKASHSHS